MYIPDKHKKTLTICIMYGYVDPELFTYTTQQKYLRLSVLSGSLYSKKIIIKLLGKVIIWPGKPYLFNVCIIYVFMVMFVCVPGIM